MSEAKKQTLKQYNEPSGLTNLVKPDKKQYNEPTVLPNLGKTDTPHNTQKKQKQTLGGYKYNEPSVLPNLGKTDKKQFGQL